MAAAGDASQQQLIDPLLQQAMDNDEVMTGYDATAAQVIADANSAGLLEAQHQQSYMSNDVEAMAQQLAQKSSLELARELAAERMATQKARQLNEKVAQQKVKSTMEVITSTVALDPQVTEELGQQYTEMMINPQTQVLADAFHQTSVQLQ
jgi:hypothetical protein